MRNRPVPPLSAARVLVIAALAVIGVGQMAGDVFHLPAVKGIAAATAASPAPKVFSAIKGLETYSTRFFLEWTDSAGVAHSEEITPQRYEGLRGPYNRRNVFGAVLAYGPVLVSDPRTRPMFEAVSAYALCGQAPLLKELDVKPRGVRGALRIRLETRPGIPVPDLPLVFEPACS